RSRRLALVDAGRTLLVLSRPLALLQLLMTVLLGALCVWLVPGLVSSGLLAAGLGALLLQGIYFGLGVRLVGLNAGRLALLARSPVVLMWLFGAALAGLVAGPGAAWARTPRASVRATETHVLNSG